MEQHYGQIVEMIIRKKGHSISDLARMAQVDRRTVYYWFTQKYLKTEIIYRIGHILNHDFSIQFPNLFTKEDFQELKEDKATLEKDAYFLNVSNKHIWKDRYISLLEEYNSLLRSFFKIDNKSVAEPSVLASNFSASELIEASEA